MHHATLDLVSPDHVIQAWRWLCTSRRNFPANADIWHLRFHRAAILPKLLAQLSVGEYRLSPMQRIVRTDGEKVAL